MNLRLLHAHLLRVCCVSFLLLSAVGTWGITVPPWSAATELTVPAIGMGAPGLSLRERHTAVAADGRDVIVRELFLPSARAAWVGLDYEAYAVASGNIWGFRVVGRTLLLRRGVSNIGTDAQLEVVAADYAAHLSSASSPTPRLHDDFGMDLAVAIGSEALTGRHAGPPFWAKISGTQSLDGNIVVSLKTHVGRDVSIQFNEGMVPWQLAVDGRASLLLGESTFDPRTEDSAAWGFPRALQVKSKQGDLAAIVRISHSLSETRTDGVEKQMALVSMLDGRLWLGPGDSDIVACKRGLVGFMVDGTGQLLATVSSPTIPKTKADIVALREWRTSVEDAIRAKTAPRQRLVNLAAISDLPVSATKLPVRTGAIKATCSDDGITLRIPSSEGTFVVQLSEDLEVGQVQFDANPVADPTDRAFRDDCPP